MLAGTSSTHSGRALAGLARMSWLECTLPCLLSAAEPPSPPHPSLPHVYCVCVLLCRDLGLTPALCSLLSLAVPFFLQTFQ